MPPMTAERWAGLIESAGLYAIAALAMLSVFLVIVLMLFDLINKDSR